MSDIDRQRWTAVKLLRSLGYEWHDGEWLSPDDEPEEDLTASFISAADDLYEEIRARTRELDGAEPGSPEADEAIRLSVLGDLYILMRPRE